MACLGGDPDVLAPDNALREELLQGSANLILVAVHLSCNATHHSSLSGLAQIMNSTLP